MHNYSTELEKIEGVYEEFVSQPVNSLLSWNLVRTGDVYIDYESLQNLLNEAIEQGYRYRFTDGHFSTGKFLYVFKDALEIAFFHYNSSGKYCVRDIFVSHQSDQRDRNLLNLVKKYGTASDGKINFKWIISHEGNYEYIEEEFVETVRQENYPFIPNLSDWQERFFASKSPVLILIGQPGVGKSMFIKHLLSKMGGTNHLTFDDKALRSEQVFVDFIIDEEANSFILEDADNLLTKREDGNDVMSKFLNISNGLISLNKKKFIFSTNLENLNNVDSALLRPGRCFDVLTFRKLNYEESIACARVNDINPDFIEKGNSYTLAEIFAGGTRKENRIGFV